jgi:hypothetical protein
MKYEGEWTGKQDLYTKCFMNGKHKIYQHAEGGVHPSCWFSPFIKPIYANSQFIKPTKYTLIFTYKRYT